MDRAIIPQYSGSDSSSAFIESMNADRPHPGMGDAVFTISSREFRLGGARLTVFGSGYDRETLTVYEVHGSDHLSGPHNKLNSIPPARYEANIGQEGLTVFKRVITFNGGSQEFAINVDGAVSLKAMARYPSAATGAYVGYGSLGYQPTNGKEFSFTTFVAPNDVPYVMLTLPIPRLFLRHYSESFFTTIRKR